MKSDVDAIVASRASIKKQAYLDNFLGDPSILQQAFDAVGNLTGRPTTLLETKYSVLMRGQDLELEEALDFANFWSLLQFVAEDVKARVVETNRTIDWEVVEPYLSRYPNPAMMITWKECLADGNRTIDDFMIYLDVQTAPPPVRTQNRAQGRPTNPPQNRRMCCSTGCRNVPAVGKAFPDLLNRKR